MPVCFFVVVPATDFFPRNPLCDVDCGSTLFPQTLSTTTSEAAHPCGDLSHKLWRERSTSACTVARASHRSTSSTDRPGVPVRVLQEGVSVARGAARPPPSSPRVRARELAWLAGARLRGRGWLRSVALGSPAALPDPQTDVFPPTTASSWTRWSTRDPASAKRTLSTNSLTYCGQHFRHVRVE